MFIERLHIDRFGILHDQDVSDLSPGLCLFLGKNEAGKSTCLRFFQSMLFGYKRGNRTLDPMPDQRGKSLAGGSLFLRTRDFGDFTLTRRPGVHGGSLSLSDASGSPVDESVLQRLLGGLTVEVFDNIFAFSLKNLMELASLKGDSVRHALHGAAFGLGLQSPAQVLKELDDRMGALLKRDTASSSAAINNLSRELADLREDLRARTPDMRLYSELQGRLDVLETTLDALHAARAPQENALRRVRRRLAVWQQWEEARRVREELSGLDEGSAAMRGGRPGDADDMASTREDGDARETEEAENAGSTDTQRRDLLLPGTQEADGQRTNWPAPGACELDTRRQARPLSYEDAAGAQNVNQRMPVFAPDAVQRLDALIAQRDERLAAEREAERACALLERDIASLASSSELAALYPAVQGLREQKARRRDEGERLPALVQECAGLVRLQEQTLARLGPDWDASRIASADASIFSKEALAGHGRTLTEAEAALVRAERERARLAEEQAEAARQEESARRALQAHVPPEHPLPEKPAVESLMAGLAQARSALGELPRLRERASLARTEAERSLSDIDPAWTPADLRECDTSLNSRQSLSGHGAAIAETASRREAARRALDACEAAVSLAENAAAALEERCARYGDVPDSAGLEARHSMLRRIERLSIELAAARRDYETASSALNEHLASMRDKNGWRRLSAMARNPFFLAGALLALAGLGIVGAVALGEGRLFLYAGAGLAVLAFAACLHCSISASSGQSTGQADEAALRYAHSLAESRRQRLTQALAGMASQAASWLSAASPGEPGEADIERALRLLERQGQHLALLERDQQELFAARQTLAAARERRDRAAEEVRQAAAFSAGALALWREHLLALKLDSDMRPEAAAGIFDRVDTARTRASVADEAEKAVLLALDGIRACLREAGELPFFAAWLAKASEVRAGRDAPERSLSPQDETLMLRRSLAALDTALTAYREYEEARQEQRGLQSVLHERTETRLRAELRLAGAGEAVEAARIALKRAHGNWTDWLAGFGFAATLSPQGAAEALEAMLAFMAREKELRAKQSVCAGITGNLEAFTREVALLAHKAGLGLPDGMRVEEDGGKEHPEGPEAGEAGDASRELLSLEGSSGSFRVREPRFRLQRPAPALVPAALQLLDQVSAKVEAAVVAKNRLAEKEEQLAGRSQDLFRARTALELTAESLSTLLAGAGVPDPEHFRAAFALNQRTEELRARERSLLAGIRALAAEEGESAAELLASLEQTNLDALREEEALLTRELADSEQEARERSVERGQLLERRAALAGSEGGGTLRLREAVLVEDLRRLSRRWSVLALAREFLLRAKTRFEEEGQQGVIRFAGDLFAAITDGEYTGIAASLEGDAFAAVHCSGDRRDPERQLSQGTREQLYLALRLAYSKNHAAKAEPLPIIMDDILVNFDPVRAANTAKALAAFAKDSQVLFFTCHPAAAELLLQTASEQSGKGPAPAAYQISRGEIQPWRLGPK